MAESHAQLVERLVHEHGAAMRGFIARRVRDRSEVEDLVQEVYARMLELPNPEQIRHAAHYMFTVAANLVCEYGRRSAISRRAVDVDDPAIQVEVAAESEIGIEVDCEARTRRMLEVFSELSPTAQSVVKMRFWDGLSYKEIAVKHDMTTDGVKKHLVQSLALFRRRMGRLK